MQLDTIHSHSPHSAEENTLNCLCDLVVQVCDLFRNSGDLCEAVVSQDSFMNLLSAQGLSAKHVERLSIEELRNQIIKLVC